MIASGELRRRSRGFLLPVALILLAETIGRIVELNSLTVAIPSSVADLPRRNFHPLDIMNELLLTHFKS